MAETGLQGRPDPRRTSKTYKRGTPKLPNPAKPENVRYKSLNLYPSRRSPGVLSGFSSSCYLLSHSQQETEAIEVLVSCNMASSAIMCVNLKDEWTYWSKWYLIKVPAPLGSRQRAFQRVRDLARKKPTTDVMNRFGMKKLNVHYHNEQPGLKYPRIEFGQPFGSSYFCSNPVLAVLGKVFYLIGGRITFLSGDSSRLSSRKKKLRKNKSTDYSTNVYCCHVSVSSLSISSYDLIPGMKTPRRGSLTVVLGGKIYVLGGVDPESGAESPWMEEFDPIHQSWTDRPSPPVEAIPHYKTDYACAAVDQEIIYMTPDEVCFFSVKHKVWHKIINTSKPGGVYGDSITLDGIVYWYEGEKNAVFAYNPRTNEWEEECDIGVIGRGFCSAVPMAHVGQCGFCILWTSYNVLHCFHFKLSSSRDSFLLLDNEGCIWGRLPSPAHFKKCWFIGEESVLAEA